MKKNRINRIPLNERLNNINKGYAGDEAYNTEAIIRFANIPIMEYLGAFHVECGGMLRSLHIKRADAQFQRGAEPKQVEKYIMQEELQCG